MEMPKANQMNTLPIREMSKKQATLFQSWNNASKKIPSSNSTLGAGDIIDLSDDEDDLLLAMAMEESLRNIEQVENDSSNTPQGHDLKKKQLASKESALFKTFNSKVSTSSNCSDSRQNVINKQSNFSRGPLNTNQPSTSRQHTIDQLASTEDVAALNISFGHEEVTPTPSSVDTTQIQDLPGFDKYAGKLWIYPTNYPVRDYQYNIVQHALFKNTLVTLPTGLGKTFIAAVVMYNFYRWYPLGKIVFMAPTKPLVAQQIEACYNIMGIPQKDTAEMTGTMSPDKRAVAWKTKRVFFLTPQVLNNDLSRGLCPSEEVKCIVVDEAHKALGNHAYCQVVNELAKYSREFRVLALSATPGSDIKAVQKVLHNLLISHIEIRTEECIDIRPYVHERKVDKVVVKLDEDLKQTKAQYVQILDHIVQRLTRFNVLTNRNVESLSKFQILQTRNQFRQDPPPNLQRMQMGAIEGDFALCMSLYHGFELLQLHGLRSLYSYLNSLVSGEKGFGRTRTELLKNSVFNDIMHFLHEKYGPKDQTDISNTQAKNAYQFSHPKLKKLQEVVLDHFAQFQNVDGSDGAQPAQTRIMIFSQYRESVGEITEMLNMYKPMVKVMSFIGQSSTGKSSKGFTQKEQLKVMKQFRLGGYNTLVATCVGEEGLDIGDVDLIICFDASKSPIRLVQRMGRTGRKRDGRIVMLVTEGKEEQIYNQSQYSKKSIHKAILNGARSLHFYDQNPRMIPVGLTPQAHKMHITVKQTFKPATKCQGDGDDGAAIDITEWNDRANAVKKKKTVADGFLTEEELAYWTDQFKVDDKEIAILPPSTWMCLSDDKQENDRAGRLNGLKCLSLSDWTPWQNRFQTAHFSGHSMKTRHLVEAMEFIEIQNALGGDEDNYGIEMAMYLNMDDVHKDKDASILKYCSKDDTKQKTEPKKRATEKVGSKGGRLKKRIVNRRSDTLPQISDDEKGSEEELPDMEALCSNQTVTKRLAHDTVLPDLHLEDGREASLDDCGGAVHKADPVPTNGVEFSTKIRGKKVSDMGTKESLETKIMKVKDKKKLKRSTTPVVLPITGEDIAEDAGDFEGLNPCGSNNAKYSPNTSKTNNDSLYLSQLFPVFERGKLKRTLVGKSPILKKISSFASRIVSTEDDSSSGEDSPVFDKSWTKSAFTGHMIREAPSVDDIDDELDNLDSELLCVGSSKLDTSELLGLVGDWKREQKTLEVIKMGEISPSRNAVNMGLESRNGVNIGEVTMECDFMSNKEVPDVARSNGNDLVVEFGDELEIDIPSRDVSAIQTDVCHADFGDNFGDLPSPVFEKLTQDNRGDSDATKCVTRNSDTFSNSPNRTNAFANDKQVSHCSKKNGSDLDSSLPFCANVGKNVIDVSDEGDDFDNDIVRKNGLKQLRLKQERKVSATTSTPVGKYRSSPCTPLISPLNHGNFKAVFNNTATPVLTNEPSSFLKKPDPSLLDRSISKKPDPSYLDRSISKKGKQLAHGRALVKSSPVHDESDADLFTSMNMSAFATPNQASNNRSLADNSQISFTQALAFVHDTPRTTAESRKPLRKGLDLNIQKKNKITLKCADADMMQRSAHERDTLCEKDISNKGQGQTSDISDESSKGIQTTDLTEPKFDLGFDIDFDDDEFDDEIIPPSPGTQPFVQMESNVSENIKRDTERSSFSTSLKTKLSLLPREACLNVKSDRVLSNEEESQIFPLSRPVTVIPDTEAFPMGPDDDIMPDDLKFWDDTDSETENIKPEQDIIQPVSTDHDGDFKTDDLNTLEDIGVSDKVPQDLGVKDVITKTTSMDPVDEFEQDSPSFWEGIQTENLSNDLSVETKVKHMEAEHVFAAYHSDSNDGETKGEVPRKPRLSLKRKSNTSVEFGETSGNNVKCAKLVGQGDNSTGVAQVKPFQFEQKEESDSEEEDFGVRRKKKKVAILESPLSEVDTSPVCRAAGKSRSDQPEFATPKRPGTNKRKMPTSDDSRSDNSFHQPKKPFFQLLPSLSSDDDDDFADNSVCKPTVTYRSDKNRVGRKMQAKKKGRSNFLEIEAELSGDDASSDESDNSTYDKFEASFINDCTQYQSHIGEDSPDMRAVYMNSVRSPQIGRYKLKYNYNTGIDVFSQAPREEDEESEYLEDSFCVDTEDETGEMDQTDALDGTMALICDQPSRVPDGKSKAKGRKRILVLEDSSPEEHLHKQGNSNNRVPPISEHVVSRINPPVHNYPSAELNRQSSINKPVTSVSHASFTSNNGDLHKQSLSILLTGSSSRFNQSANSANDLQKQERLRRQREKQDEFRKMLAEQKESTITKPSTSSTATCQVVTPMSDKRQTKGKLVIFVDSREISGAQNLVSSLRLTCNINAVVCQLTGCDYIVGHRMGVERKLMSDFTNGSNRTKLAERIQLLCHLFDRPCLILEKDRVKPGHKSPTLSTRTKYVDNTLSQLAHSNVKVLFSDSQEETAQLLADLAAMENKKDMAVCSYKTLTPVEDQAVKFYLSFPKITFVTALNLVKNFNSVQEFMNSPVEDIASKGLLSAVRAKELFSYIRRRFDPQMVPSSSK